MIAEASYAAFHRDSAAFLRHLKDRRLSPQTLVTRKENLQDFIRFAVSQGRRGPQDVEAADIHGYRDALAARGFRASSMNGYLSSVRLFFRYLETEGLLFENPARDLHLPRPQQLPPAILSEREMQCMLETVDTSNPLGVRDRAILEVLYSTGIRREECLCLELADVDIDAGTLNIRGKGGTGRLVPLGRHASHWLQRYLVEVRPQLNATQSGNPRLWLGCKGAPMKSCRLAQTVRGHARKAGLMQPVSPHTIRRTCATHMSNGGAHPAAVAAILGHRRLKTLRHYLRLGIADLRKAHAATKPGE